MSLVESGEADGVAAFGRISADAVPSEAFGADPLNDCRPIGVGDVIEGIAGAGAAGLAASSAGQLIKGVCSLELSVAGNAGTLPLSSSVIASLNVPSTMITTLAPTSTERILEVTVDASVDFTFALSRAGSLSGPRAGLSTGGAAAAAWAARRAAAMKFEVLLGSRVPVVISLIALSEAAMRSDGDGTRAEGRVPGSSG